MKRACICLVQATIYVGVGLEGAAGDHMDPKHVRADGELLEVALNVMREL